MEGWEYGTEGAHLVKEQSVGKNWPEENRLNGGYQKKFRPGGGICYLRTDEQQMI